MRNRHACGQAVSMEICINKRLTLGAPGKEAMEQVIAANKVWLGEHECIKQPETGSFS